MERKKEKYFGWAFVGGVFLLTFLYAAVQPFDASPDERMRYEIVEYLCEYGRLPHGGDPALRNEIWGISYAFNPILSYMISAVFVKIAGLFFSHRSELIIAARLVNVLWITGSAWLTLKISGRLFHGGLRWLFPVLTAFLPGVLFVGSYVNNDALALFSAAWICWSWVCYLDEGWSRKNSLRLGAALSLCLLSYYNAYGWILVSFLFFTVTALFCEGKAWNWRLWLKRGLLVAGVAAVLAGWWFLRNALLYDGDLLGMRTSSWFSEQYAQEGFKPSQRVTPQNMGMSLWEMLWYVPGNWAHNWLVTVLVSFVGAFGYMNVFMPYALSKVYWALLLPGMAGMLASLRLFGFRKVQYFQEETKMAGVSLRVKGKAVSGEWDKERIFHTAMLLAMAIPPVLLLYYAYASDFQAQGRYLLPMALPFFYFVTKGYGVLLDRLVKKPSLQKAFLLGFAALWIVLSIAVFALVFYPAYR